MNQARELLLAFEFLLPCKELRAQTQLFHDFRDLFSCRRHAQEVLAALAELLEFPPVELHPRFVKPFRLLDMFRTTLNVTGDLAAAVVVSNGSGDSDGAASTQDQT